MIEANKLIFPSPKLDSSSDQQLLVLQNNLVFIPKSIEAPVGCMCHTITHHNYNPSSTVTTARTHREQHQKPIIKIQPSKQLKLSVTQPKHKHSSARLINLVTSQSRTPLENAYQSLKTPRDNLSSNIQDGLWTQRFQHYLAKRKSKFLSDELYCEEQSEEGEGRVKIESIPVNKYKFLGRIENYLSKNLLKYKNKVHGPSIPCLLFESSKNVESIIVYFHGNGEDIIGCGSFLKKLSNNLQTSLLAVEYPGYSVYQGSPTCEHIQKDAIEVLQFLINNIGYRIENIVIIGRSIGSGPAIYLSTIFPIAGLILISPFLSLCEVVGDLYGSIASHLLKQRFNNKERAKLSHSPCLIVHGIKDRLIPQRHTTELSQYFQGYCKVRLVSNMTHSLFNHEQFFSFVAEFIKQLDSIN